MRACVCSPHVHKKSAVRPGDLTTLPPPPLPPTTTTTLPTPLCADHRPPHAASGLPAQRGVHPHTPHGRAPHRRADAVQSRRETLPRALFRQQAQLVSAAVTFHPIRKADDSNLSCEVKVTIISPPTTYAGVLNVQGR